MILNLIKKETEYDYKIEYNKYHCLDLNTLKLGHTETQLHHQHRQLDARTHTHTHKELIKQTDRGGDSPNAQWGGGGRTQGVDKWCKFFLFIFFLLLFS